MPKTRVILALVLPILISAFGSARAEIIEIDVMGRTVEVHIPDCYDPGEPIPIVMALHGAGSTGADITNYYELLTVAEEYCFIYTAPDGIDDVWNANEFLGNPNGPDDSSFLRGVIEAIQALYVVDAQRIFIIGFSNGGHMAFRMASDHADLIAAIISHAGGISENPPNLPSEPVNVLHVIGTGDGCFEEGNCPWPGSVETVATWAGYNGCGAFPSSGSPLELADCNMVSPDTTVTQYTGCDPGGSTQLWIVEDASHAICFVPEWPNIVMDYFYSHPNPPPPPPFLRGDCDADGVINALTDAWFLLEFGFLGGPEPDCGDAADVDDDGVVNALADGTYLLQYGFVGGSPPPPPFPACGVDPAGSAIGCAATPCP